MMPRSYADYELETDRDVRKRTQVLRRALRQVETLLGSTATSLEELASQPTAASVRRLDRLRAQFEEAAKAYLNRTAAFIDDVREHAERVEESNRRSAMSERRPKSARDEARIQKVSEELTRELRLQRIDGAIKELLEFLADEDFFAANVSTGRRRRLRALQNAIDKALQQ